MNTNSVCSTSVASKTAWTWKFCRLQCLSVRTPTSPSSRSTVPLFGRSVHVPIMATEPVEIWGGKSQMRVLVFKGKRSQHKNTKNLNGLAVVLHSHEPMAWLYACIYMTQATTQATTSAPSFLCLWTLSEKIHGHARYSLQSSDCLPGTFYNVSGSVCFLLYETWKSNPTNGVNWSWF